MFRKKKMIPILGFTYIFFMSTSLYLAVLIIANKTSCPNDFEFTRFYCILILAIYNIFLVIFSSDDYSGQLVQNFREKGLHCRKIREK